MAVMEEVHKQMGEIASKQNDKIGELNAEIRKLKAMIVKHESRIRTLETKNRELETGSIHSRNNNNNRHSGDELDPDEVWASRFRETSAPRSQIDRARNFQIRVNYINNNNSKAQTLKFWQNDHYYIWWLARPVCPEILLKNNLKLETKLGLNSYHELVVTFRTTPNLLNCVKIQFFISTTYETLFFKCNLKFHR